MTANGADFRFRPAGQVLKRTEMAVYEEARDYLVRARQHHDDVRRSLASEVEAARARGYREGLQQGELEAARLLAQTQAGAQRLLDGLEADLCRIVLQAVQRVLGEIDVAEAVSRAVHVATNERGGVNALVVRVHPDLQETIATRIEALTGGQGSDDTPTLRVEADNDLALKDCILVTQAGYVRCGLDDQFDAIVAAVADRLGTDVRP